VQVSPISMIVAVAAWDLPSFLFLFRPHCGAQGTELTRPSEGGAGANLSFAAELAPPFPRPGLLLFQMSISRSRKGF